jgi:hypothetical protein
MFTLLDQKNPAHLPPVCGLGTLCPVLLINYPAFELPPQVSGSANCGQSREPEFRKEEGPYHRANSIASETDEPAKISAPSEHLERENEW